MIAVNIDSWQKFIALELPEIKVLLTAAKIELSPSSPLKAATAITDAQILSRSKIALQKRGLAESPGMKSGADALAVRGALEILAKPSRELMVVKMSPTEPQPKSLTFVVGASQSCLFMPAGNVFHVGAPISNTQLFGVLARDLKGGKDDFKPWDLLPMHYQLLLAIRHAGLLQPKKPFTRAVLDGLLKQLKVDAADVEALVSSAVSAGVLAQNAQSFTVSNESIALMNRLGSGEMTEVVMREVTAPPGELPKSILFAGAAGQRLRCDRPAAKGAKGIPVLSFVPVTPENLKSSVGKWLGL